MYQRLVLSLSIISITLTTGCNQQAESDGDVVRKLTSQSGPAVLYVVEAEALTELSGKFEVGQSKGASANSTLLVPVGIAKKGKVSGLAAFSFELDVPAKINCWLRVKWTGTCSNSVIIKAPGVPPKIVGESATYNTWHWVKGPPFTAKAGKTKIELGAREDGVFIDQLMLTSDLQRVPVGIESAPTLAIGDAHDPSK